MPFKVRYRTNPPHQIAVHVCFLPACLPAWMLGPQMNSAVHIALPCTFAAALLTSSIATPLWCLPRTGIGCFAAAAAYAEQSTQLSAVA